MSYREKFTHSEWRTLQFAPLWIFTLVAQIDGVTDKKEITALAKEIGDAPRYRNPLMREILLSLVQDGFDKIWDAYGEDSRSVDKGLSDVADLLDRKIDDETAEGFKLALLSIGKSVAEASAPLFGPAVSDKEKAALVVAAIALRVKVS